MPDNLALLTQADKELSTLRQSLPDLEIAMEKSLRRYCPSLAQDACTNWFFINQAGPSEPGQPPVIISKSISMLIDQCYLDQQVPTLDQHTTKVYNYAHTLDEQDRATEITAEQLTRFLAFVTYDLEQCVQDGLDDFWQTPRQEIKSLTPKDWLSGYVFDLIRAEATVRHADKTFDSASLDAVYQIFHSPSRPPARADFAFYSLWLNGQPAQSAVPLHGVFVITTKNLPTVVTHDSQVRVVQDETPRTVVLFTPSQGLETFTTLTALTQELGERLKDVYQREALLNCVLAQDRDRALAHQHVDYRPVRDKPPQTFYVEQLIHKQKRDMRHAWSMARTRKENVTLEQLNNLMDQSLNSSMLLKPASILQARHTRLHETRLPVWLKTASEADKTLWRLAVERLSHERLACETTEAFPIAQSGQKSTLLGYARLQLKQQIKADHGIEVDPDNIFISTTEALQTGAVINPISGSGFPAGASIGRTGPTISYHTTRRSLSELALANVGIWDVTFALTARITDAQGKPHTVLTHSYIKTLVRQLDVGENYKTRLMHLLVNSRLARWRKERYVSLKAAQLNLDLIEARLSGILTEDHAAWVQAVLEQPVDNNRPLVTGGQIKARWLVLRYKTLPGLLVFSSTGSTQLLCYLPDAPENTWFVVASSPSDLARKLSQPLFRNYLLSRVTSAQQAYIRPLLREGLSESNTQLRIINHHVFEASYDTEVLHTLMEADEQSTSTYESNLNTAKEAVLTVIDVISFALPTKILLPIVAARFFYQLALGYDALQRDEESEALLHFMGSISHLTDGASDFVGSSVFSRSIRARIKQPAPRLNTAVASTPVRTGLKLLTGEEYGAGVYETPPTEGTTPAHYVQDRTGNVYRSHYDSLDETWRIVDERQPDAQYRVPVHEISAGKWDIDPSPHLFSQKSGIQRAIDSAAITDVNLAGKTPDTKGVYRVGNLSYIEQSGLVFEVYSGWLGRDLYLQIPAGSSSANVRYKVRRMVGHWEIKHRISSTTKRWEPLVRSRAELPVSSPEVPYSAYDLPAEHQAIVRELVVGNDKLLHTDYVSPHPALQISSHFFKTLRVKLLLDAQAFLKTVPPRQRAARPFLTQNITPENLFNELYEQSQGVILGESHSQLSAKKILITQMGAIKNNDVGVIFLEHLQTDVHQGMLDDFFITQKMPSELDDFLKAQDAGHQLNPFTEYTYSRLVREAIRHRIPIKALDCVASYHVDGMRTRYPDVNRTEMFSYFASQVIRGHLAKNTHQKWIALTGNSHTNTFQGVPGLAELEGAIGVSLSDAAPGRGLGLLQDLAVVVPPTIWHPGHILLKADYWLEVDIPGTPLRPPALTKAQIEIKLSQTGMYLLQNIPQEGPYLIHRANSRQIARTRLQVDEGKVFIDRPDWTDIHLKRYDYLESLIADLKNLGLQPAR
ncbi:membrane-targeted effector domain-containing toxin [Pseudomonas kulmbachensis]|uniref:membrane-targeted effector domain-containing toxin n=1 Tax=Pseudomonas kulmbachensis TaxID=3043408 RepID=UPI002AB19D14|nr:membrane-targeted effector domain-containing toxin [Pseudomonas sp. V3/3/4/13]